MPWIRKYIWIIVLAAVLIGAFGYYRPPLDILDIQQSGEGFTIGNVVVSATYGYSDDGDRLRYMVIRSWPATTPPAERLADPRFSPDIFPRVRHPDGALRPVETDGRVYMFIGDELRTMRVAMNEHTDTVGLARAGSLEGIWQYLQQFRVAD